MTQDAADQLELGRGKEAYWGWRQPGEERIGGERAQQRRRIFTVAGWGGRVDEFIAPGQVQRPALRQKRGAACHA
jgi:hypothetical protein